MQSLLYFFCISSIFVISIVNEQHSFPVVPQYYLRKNCLHCTQIQLSFMGNFVLVAVRKNLRLVWTTKGDGSGATPAGGLGPRGRGIRGKGLAPRPHEGAGTCDPRWVKRSGIESKHTKKGGSKNSPTQIAEILLAKYFFCWFLLARNDGKRVGLPSSPHYTSSAAGGALPECARALVHAPGLGQP